MTFTTTTESNWKDLLRDIGIAEKFISDSLIGSLLQHGFNAQQLTEDSMGEIVEAESMEAAAVNFTKSTAEINDLQHFLPAAINWQTAWEQLSKTEGYSVHPTGLANFWVVLKPDANR